MIRPLLKKFTGFTLVLAIVSNIYIFTYPSLFPERCSWRCASQPSVVGATDSMHVGEKVLYYSKRYVNDLMRQWKKSHEETQSSPADVHLMAFGDPQIKGIWRNTPYVTRLDIFGNDFYLGHIFSTMRNRLNPTHVAVMGDLFSSQWIGDSEFFNRTMRYTKRIFKRDTTSLENIRNDSHDENGLYKNYWVQFADEFKRRLTEEPKTLGFGYENVHTWDPEHEDYLFINLTGNHDIGYSGDATFQHMSRFHQLFGKDNYWIEYDRDTDHPWRIVVLDSMLLEGPPLQQEFVNATWEFLLQLFEQRFEGSTVLLTHVPFYKKEGLCTDGELFRYYPDDYPREPYKQNLLRSQNHLSEDVTKRVLNLIFDNGKPGIILTGHDHEGCETVYNKDSKTGDWNAAKTMQSPDFHVREVTVRSMMGEFNGNTGLVTGHFNHETKTWEWSFSLCPFSIQHVWWFTKVVTILSGFLLSALLVT
ncbi:Ted1p [Lachancea thermotolerans CBS 6340]|uniref:KLTH0A03718p n=1 Tax=Lachancea thermotolerans (strain ATCC 56472 / CBS 6340 / NRRL Y-8284) TaxID=559295 RepID=C5DBM1_LACTC|nr:KLTH0A03718p [Lachancea thermotolerans CBS 6340]CAR21178.1 KLTH0A03718p [Lachancea thermotolerans CBS 6340]